VTVLHGAWLRLVIEAWSAQGGPIHRRKPAVPFKHHAECRHHIPKPRYRVMNWPEYNAALKRRGRLTVWFSDEAISAWRPAALFGVGDRRGADHALGPPSGFAADRGAHRLDPRATRPRSRRTGLLDHQSRGGTLELPPLRSPGSGSLHLWVDSTGLKLGGAGEWLIEKHGEFTPPFLA
jgi:hypothetical protein